MVKITSLCLYTYAYHYPAHPVTNSLNKYQRLHMSTSFCTTLLILKELFSICAMLIIQLLFLVQFQKYYTWVLKLKSGTTAAWDSKLVKLLCCCNNENTALMVTPIPHQQHKRRTKCA